MKKYLIKAYTELNLGDDLFIKILINKYKNVNFYLISNHNYKKIFIESNIESFKNTFFHKVLNKLANKFKKPINFKQSILLNKVDGVIEIGGSLFIESENYKNDLNLRNILLEKTRGNYFVLGSNFGHYSNQKFQKDYQIFFSKCKDVCFRDKYSYDLFSDLNNVRLAKDIVFGLNDNTSTDKNYILYSIIKPSLRKELKNKDEEYYSKIIESSLELLKEGKDIKFISFCKKEGDEEAIQKIISRIPKLYSKKVTFYNYSGDLNEALEIIKKSEIIVATRFHAMILGFVYSKKVLPIAYSNKIINVLKDLDFRGQYIDFNNLNDLNKHSILNSQSLENSKLENSKLDSLKIFQGLDKIIL